jgi:hypothetical protein
VYDGFDRYQADGNITFELIKKNNNWLISKITYVWDWSDALTMKNQVNKFMSYFEDISQPERINSTTTLSTSSGSLEIIVEGKDTIHRLSYSG